MRQTTPFTIALPLLMFACASPGLTPDASGEPRVVENVGNPPSTIPSSPSTQAPPPPAPAPLPPAPGAACTARAPSSIEGVATNTTDLCRAWAEAIRGRVGRSGPGSFAVWTRHVPSQLALIIGALHSRGAGAFAPVGSSVPERLAAPEPEGGLLRLLITPADGAFSPLRAVAFDLYHPAVPAAENSASFATIRPRNDFYVDVMDGQRFPTSEVGERLPEALVPGPVPLFDPTQMTTATPTFGEPVAGDLVAYAGFPKTGPLATSGAIGFGRVLSNAEAEAALVGLVAAGDDEGKVAYDAEAEMVIAGEGFSGMSGGGVFDRAGRLSGTIVRGSTVAVGSSGKYVRAVRTAFIAKVKRFAAAVQSASPAALYLPKP